MTTYNGTVYPDATNTGVPAGTALTTYNGDLIVNTPGAVISGLKITGSVWINAPNVTIENCSITNTDFNCVNIADGVNGTTVQDCTINGTGNGPAGQSGIGGQGTFLRNNIYNVENGIDVGGSNTVVKGNYIHDLNDSDGVNGHYDGIAVQGGFNNVTIQHNTVYGRDTSCIFIDNDFGSMDNIVVDGNLLLGQGDASYTIYVLAKANLPGQITNVKVTNNVLGDGHYGWASVERTNPVWTNNVDYATGKLVSTDNALSSAPVTTPPVTQPSSPGTPTIDSFSTDSGVVGDHITNDATLTLKGSATANSTVKVLDGSTQVGTATADASGAWTLTTTALSNGGHSLTATATNSGGTSGKSAALSVTIDTQAPAAPTIVAPTAAAAATSTGTQASTQALSGTAEAGSTVTIFDGATKVGSATASATGAWSYTTGALSTGNHSFTAAATDAAGNTGTASKPVVVTIASAPTTPTPPTSPAAPTISSFSNDSGVLGDRITNDNTLELKGTAAAGSTVTIYDGKTQLGTTKADPTTGSWDYITKVLTDATHTLTATATNASGQTSAASAALAVTVDTQTPTPTITGNTVNSAHQVVLTGTAEAKSTVKVYDGTTPVGTATTDASGVWSVTTSALSTGSHVLTAKATDVAGNVSAVSAAVNPVISGSSGSGSGSNTPAAPKISSFSKDTGVVGDHITSDNTVTLTGTAVAKSTVNVYDGKTQIGHVTADAKGAWSYTTAALPDGNHTFTATDTVSGATSAKSAALALTVDTSAPDAPVLLTDAITHHRATVTGTAEAGSTVKVYEGTSLLGSATTGADGHFSVTTSGLSTGSHTFVASATDAAGNTSAMSQPIDPPVGSHGPNGSTVDLTNVFQHWWDHTATIKGTAVPNSQIKLFDGTASVGSVTVGTDGKWSFHTSDLSGKTHAFTAGQVDATGHSVGTSSGAAMIGTNGSNTLTGTTGNDIMVGKGGADTFVFASNFGRDVIKDFAAGGPAHDTVQFSKSVFDNFASVLSHAAQSGHDVVVTAGSDTLTLKNTQLDKLKSHDFHFA